MLAIDRAKQLFGAAFANVQPHSGSQANAAAYLALLSAGDVVLGMSLDDGGHLTHGAPVNFSGKLYHAVQYGLDAATGEVDYDQVAALAQQHRPKLIVAGFSAYSRKLDWQRFRDIADSVGAYFLVDMAHVAGLVAAGLYPNPVPFADVVTIDHAQDAARPARRHDPRARECRDREETELGAVPRHAGRTVDARHRRESRVLQGSDGTGVRRRIRQQVLANARVMATEFQQRGYKVVSGGTDNHLFLLDLIDKKITGKDADAALGRANITVNKNAVPNDPRSPFVTSGLAHRHAGRHDARFQGSRVQDADALDVRCARRSQERQHDRAR